MNFFRYITFILLVVGCNNVKNRQFFKIAKPPQRSTIIVSGDYMQHGPQITAARSGSTFDYSTSLKYINPIWKSADFALINFETTLTNSGQYSGYPLFASPVESVSALKQNGITHIALANNHIMDKGYNGVKQTIEKLEQIELPYFGVALSKERIDSVVLIEKGNIKIALLNYTYGTNGMGVPKGVYVNSGLDTTVIKSEIERTKSAGATHTIAFLHWGEEYQRQPNKAQKELALWLRKSGVNIVIGSHPHVPQPIDSDNSIVYSLGNFVSNQPFPYTYAGYSVKITFYEGVERPKIDYIPHYVDLSASGVEKYRVLMPKDSSVLESKSDRDRIRKAIEDVREIVNSKVRY